MLVNNTQNSELLGSFKDSEFIQGGTSTCFASRQQQAASPARPSQNTVKTLDSYINAGRYQIESHCGQFIYHLAIIDYLQEWNFEKRAEAFLKRNFKGRSRCHISCVPPLLYCHRFNRFVKTEVLGSVRNEQRARAVIDEEFLSSAEKQGQIILTAEQ